MAGSRKRFESCEVCVELMQKKKVMRGSVVRYGFKKKLSQGVTNPTQHSHGSEVPVEYMDSRA